MARPAVPASSPLNYASYWHGQWGNMYLGIHMILIFFYFATDLKEGQSTIITCDTYNKTIILTHYGSNISSNIQLNNIISITSFIRSQRGAYECSGFDERGHSFKAKTEVHYYG